MKCIWIIIGVILCASPSFGNQEAVQDDEQVSPENGVREGMEKEADHATVSGFTMEDSSWKIIWHGSSDADLLVGDRLLFLCNSVGCWKTFDKTMWLK